jgi:hypothetical protein
VYTAFASIRRSFQPSDRVLRRVGDIGVIVGRPGDMNATGDAPPGT